MVRARSLLWNQTIGTRFELAVLDDCKTYSAKCQGCVVNADTSLYWSWVVRVGQMAGLGPFNLFDVFERRSVPSIMTGTGM